jgi:tRNA dimethylallyltransferase
MLAAGWVEETRQLVLAGLLRTPTARQALGYREIAAFLDAGPSDIPLLAQRLVERTAQYARRQRTWFRHQHPDATAVELNPGDTPRCLAGRILSQISAVRPPVIHA